MLKPVPDLTASVAKGRWSLVVHFSIASSLKSPVSYLMQSSVVKVFLPPFWMHKWHLHPRIGIIVDHASKLQELWIESFAITEISPLFGRHFVCSEDQRYFGILTPTGYIESS
jgi:hypothetical protein